MVDIISLMEIGANIQIIDKKNSEQLFLNSTIIEIDRNNKTIDIYNPIYENRLYTISKKKIYIFRYVDKNSGIYSFEGIILDRIKEKGLYILKVKFNGNVKKIQRREFFRINLMKNVLIKKPINEKYYQSDKLIEHAKYINFLEKIYPISDISGGGLGFYSNKRFDKKIRVVAEINLSESKISVISEIVRVLDTKDSNNKYLICLKFINVDSSTRRIIINFVFGRQRELRKKGLI